MDYEKIISGILSLLGVFSVIAKFTPNQSDNKIVDSLYKVVNVLGLSKKVKF